MRWVCDDGECVLCVSSCCASNAVDLITTEACRWGDSVRFSKRLKRFVSLGLCGGGFCLVSSNKQNMANGKRNRTNYAIEWISLYSKCVYPMGSGGLGFAIWINCVWKVEYESARFIHFVAFSSHPLYLFIPVSSEHSWRLLHRLWVHWCLEKRKKNCTHHYRERRGTKINCIRTDSLETIKICNTHPTDCWQRNVFIYDYLNAHPYLISQSVGSRFGRALEHLKANS